MILSKKRFKYKQKKDREGGAGRGEEREEGSETLSCMMFLIPN